MPPKQPSNGWTPVDETAAPATSSNGWTPVEDQQQPDQGGAASRFLTRFTGLPVHDIVQHPGAYLNPFSKEYQQKGMEEHPPAPAQNPGESLSDYASRTAGPVSVPIPGQQTIQDVKSGNYAGALGDVAGPALTVGSMVAGAPEESKAFATAPIRGVARAAEAAINSKLGSAVRIMTPADEASASIKVPGRDFGLKRGQLAEDFKNPGAPFPENSPQGRLPEAFQPAKPKAPAPVGTTDNPFKAPASPEPETPAQPEIKRGSLPKMMNDLETGVRKGLGGSPSPLETPKAPIYQRGSLSSMMKEGSPDLMEGHTATPDSSWIKSYKYDPNSQVFEMATKDGGYRYSGVTPEMADEFAKSKSAGTAFPKIKNGPGVVNSEKLVNGKWVAVKGVSTRQ
jgi:hypothetical protein